MKFVVYLLLPALMLTACQSPRQSAADAVAGIDAMQLVMADYGIDSDIIATIAAGSTDYILATQGMQSRDELPRPRMAPSGIAAHPYEYAESASHTREQAAQSGWLLGLLGGGGLLAALLAVARKTGLGGPFVEIIARMMERPGGPHRNGNPRQPSDKNEHHA